MFRAGQDGRCDAEHYCPFLGPVVSKTRQRVILIHAGAPYHRAADPKAWLIQHAAQVTVYTLPSYSPDYNPIEHVGRYVKAGTHNSYFALFQDLVARVAERLGQLTANRARVHQLMGTPLDAVAGVPARAA